MATMVKVPYVNHVATLTGGVGYEDLARFYKYHFTTETVTVSMACGVHSDAHRVVATGHRAHHRVSHWQVTASVLTKSLD